MCGGEGVTWTDLFLVGLSQCLYIFRLDRRLLRQPLRPSSAAAAASPASPTSVSTLLTAAELADEYQADDD